MRTSSIRRRSAQLVAVAAMSVASIFATASGASALSAHTYGFQCSNQHQYVRQNWPNIKTDSTRNVNVYMYTTLYKWTSSGWRVQRSSQWFNGVSNNTGHKVIDWDFGSQPIYWVYHSSTGTRPGPQLGYAFTHLSPGYYATIETFQVGTRRWTSQGHEFVAGTSNGTACWA